MDLHARAIISTGKNEEIHEVDTSMFLYRCSKMFTLEAIRLETIAIRLEAVEDVPLKLVFT